MLDKDFKLIKFQPKRTFGVELEFPHDFDREFLRECIRSVGEQASIVDWRHDNNNDVWVCKTDSSCGFEAASRVLGSKRSVKRTVQDLTILCRVVEVMKERGARSTERCGTHVHVWVGDMDDEQLTKMLAYWVKFEKTIVDMMPQRRKRNNFCPCPSGFLRPNTNFRFRDLLSMGFNQRGSLNWNWYETRKTVEIRLAEGTVEPDMIKNWVRFILYFMDKVKDFPPHENVNWLTLEESLTLLDLFNAEEDDEFRILSPALTELRAWILHRMNEHAGYRDSAVIKEKTQRMMTYVQ